MSIRLKETICPNTSTKEDFSRCRSPIIKVVIILKTNCKQKYVKTITADFGISDCMLSEILKILVQFKKWLANKKSIHTKKKIMESMA